MSTREVISEIGEGTQIIDDNIDVEFQMGQTSDGEPIFWDLIEIEIKRSQIDEPDYASGLARPKTEFIEDIRERVNDVEQKEDRAFGIDAIVGGEFSISVDTSLSVREADTGNLIRSRTQETDQIEEFKKSLLFKGNVAKLTPMGERDYEFMAYDPSEQPFNTEADSGSLINKKLEITGQSGGIEIVSGDTKPEEQGEENSPGQFRIGARELVETIIQDVPIPEEDVNIDLQPVPDFLLASDETLGASRQDLAVRTDNAAALNNILRFDKAVVPLTKALNRAREATASEWWINRKGEFYFGDPGELDGGVNVFDMRLVKDTSAGITTPPYQSVKVIGSGLASSGEESTSFIQDDDNKIVKAVNIGFPEDTETPRQKTVSGFGTDTFALFEPTFTYVNTSITTDLQAENTANKIAEDLIKQQREGTVKVVGMPEVDVFDGIRMPNTRRQPMGGRAYEVYSVKHIISSTDGFVTEITVAGPSGSTNQVLDAPSNAELLAAGFLPADRDLFKAAKNLEENSTTTPSDQETAQNSDEEEYSPPGAGGPGPAR